MDSHGQGLRGLRHQGDAGDRAPAGGRRGASSRTAAAIAGGPGMKRRAATGGTVRVTLNALRLLVFDPKTKV